MDAHANSHTDIGSHIHNYADIGPYIDGHAHTDGHDDTDGHTDGHSGHAKAGVWDKDAAGGPGGFGQATDDHHGEICVELQIKGYWTMTMPEDSSSRGPQHSAPTAHQTAIGRSQQDSIAALSIVVVSLLLVVSLVSLGRSLVSRVQAEAAYEATLAEIADRHRLGQLDEGTLRQQLAAAEQSLNDLSAAIPSEAEARAELARYDLYAAEANVSVELEPRVAVRQASTEAGVSEMVTQRWRMQVRGQAGDIVRFLDRVAGGRPATWKIENVVIKPDDSAAATGEESAMGTADLIVYCYAEQKMASSLYP
jgi:hypothetical protein